MSVKELSNGTREVFDYHICGDCGSAYIDQFPKDISKYYENYYSLAEAIPTIEKSRLKQIAVGIYANVVVKTGLSGKLRNFFRLPRPWEMRFLSPNLQAFLFLGVNANARILDVGSGNGEFVRMMKRFGYRKASGIDPFLSEHSGEKDVVRGDIHSASGTYDVVLFNHSLEHMSDPEAALRSCSNLLAANGIVLIHIPNMDSREFFSFKQHWCWMHAPHHFAIPSRRGIVKLAQRVGLELVDSVYTSRADHYLYSDEYRRDIGDRDPNSVRRQLEDGSFDKAKYSALAELAYSLNRNMTGDWVAYYLKRRVNAN